MRARRRLLLAALAPGAALAAWLALLAAVLLLLPGQDGGGGGAALAAVLASHGAAIFALWALGAVVFGWLARQAALRYLLAPAQLAEGAALLAEDAGAPLLPEPGHDPADALARAVNRLAMDARATHAEKERMVAEASRKVAQERDQLGALMAELQQSVVVCNLEGRILLYNARARALFHRLTVAPNGSGAAGGAELIGLGRPIHAVLDPALIDHALEGVRHRIARDEGAVSARFVMTAPAGHLLQVILAPVPSHDGAAALGGYVLLLDDITQDHATQSRRDRRLIELTEASRRSLASIRAALEMLDYPDLDQSERDGFHAVLRDEVNAMSARLSALTEDASQDLLSRWPLQDMPGGDLLGAAARQIAADTGQEVEILGADPASPDPLWLSVDSFSLVQALAFLAGRLGPGANPGLRLAQAGNWAHLDLCWPTASGIAAPAGWQAEGVPLGGSASTVTLREIAERHGGELWLEHDRAAGLSCFRFLLPLASEAGGEQVLPPRPEYYDFDLFAPGQPGHALDDRPLDGLTLTVFDTETTGLDPTGGDEIIQIGAVRILNGRLIQGEVFDQLVDPGRAIPEASIPFHGIRPEMVRGQPRIGQVLPAFHAFAQDSVLVGHNVAFDMRFLQMKQADTGLRFDQPVLDTLLLASVAQPRQQSYALEEIAARLGVPVTARHSAAGDALTTARLLLKLIPLLRQQGIVTLAQAREAAEKSYYARLKY